MITGLARHALRFATRFKIESSVALLNLATVAIGFILQIVVLRLTGPSREADSYFATAAIPQVALSIASSVVAGALMPQLSRLDRPTRIATVWSLLGMVLLIGLPIGGAFYLTAPIWTFLVFPGFANGAAPESVQLAALAALASPVAIASSILSGYLYAERRFVINETISLVTAGVLVLSAVITIPRCGVVSLGWLVLARFALQMALIMTFLPLASWRGAGTSLRTIAEKARALLAGAIYFKSDLLVDRYLLSLAPAGALSLVVFGQSIFSAAAGVVGQSLASTATPTLTVAHEAGDAQGFRAVLRRNLVLITAASVAVVLAGVALVPPIASLLTKRDIANDQISLRWVLILFGGIPIGAGIGVLFANAFYAMGDTRTPTIMTVVTFTVFIILKIVIFSSFGLYVFCGLTSLYYLGNGALLGWLLRQKMRREFST
ncbi:lipid II flippase MurJ [Sphingomonas sp. 3-13AW]|uniref:lipid II flippase MurJ n=1 Tax=Sphingomonas sp. 3-13AW TaxID=3050450 RepID=UPI003BB72CE5